MKIGELQEQDPQLRKMEEGDKTCRYYRKNGILFRKGTPRGSQGEEYEQLVVPRKYRAKVLQLAHSIPLAGHMGRDRTATRILKRFFWPNIFKDVADYCHSCPECQKAARKTGQRAPMIPLPITGQPFERIAMDIVGPLPRSIKSYRCILVVCDYATRYLEAITLKKFTADAVAEELITLFARYGVPKEILTDQDTNFTSQLLQELYKLLGVKPIRTTPYHPQTVRLVERFNKTLKGLLRKIIQEEGREWEKYLPYFLFAYREVPQESTGFSPFELISGRDVRGPLDILKEQWSKAEEPVDDILTYVTKVRERMKAAREIVIHNMKKSQNKQNEWYDLKARDMKLRIGDLVLVLLPTSTRDLVLLPTSTRDLVLVLLPTSTET